MSFESIAVLLQNSLNPATSRDAEKQLREVETQPGFSLTLLQLVSAKNLAASVRLSGAIFFKNFLKRKFIDEDGNYKIAEADLRQIKASIIDIMLDLPDNLQVQMGESISIIAESDFPDRWTNLVDELVTRLSPTDWVRNKGVLTVAHSIFRRWRPLFRSDALFLEIKLVLEKFQQPFLHLLVQLDQLISTEQSTAQLACYFDALLLLVKIYYDLNCQDIPEFFEDNLAQGMGIIHKYLHYAPASVLQNAAEDDEIDVVTRVQTAICELVSLYTTRYEDVFEPLIGDFIQTVWALLTAATAQPKNDLLVSRALAFLDSVVKIAKFQPMFSQEAALKEIVEKILLPNVRIRDTDEELFEDDPIEYIRRDLEGSDSDTRRRSATDFLRSLKENVDETLVTNVTMVYVNSFLAEYQANAANWKAKDMAVYLFSALATKGAVTQSGVTSTNLLIDVVKFFTDNVAADLMATKGALHPILKVDAIKYIYIFRNQLTKQQLFETFPLLSAHLTPDNDYVVYTYTAITLEKILSIHKNNRLLFTKADITSQIAYGLVSNLFKLTLNSSSPEKLAENEFLMKTIMRILLTSENNMAEHVQALLAHLVSIVEVIAKNPSNPRFSHYTFECIAILIKHSSHTATGVDGAKVIQLIELVLPSLLGILGSDVQEFVPYVFQILAYLLELLPKEHPLPQTYQQLIKPLMSPSVWEFRGNIPGVTRLLQAIVAQQASVFYEPSPEALTPLLGVFQKLISSKVNDVHGFELLETILINVPVAVLQPFLKQVAMVLLQRLQTSKTEKFVRKLTVFVASLAVLPNLGPDFAVQFLDEVQPGVFGQVYLSFVLPTSASIANILDRKIVVAGLSNLTTSSQFTTGSYTDKVLPTLEVLLKLATSESISGLKADSSVSFDQEYEFEEISFGSNFSKLIAIANKPLDPAPALSNTDKGQIKAYITANLEKLNQLIGGSLSSQVLPNLSPEAQAFFA
ncbi:hypothetical protein BABINDRAFT_166560 [Babjeviella inositovora NRRL Y-12698]|uniref:Importin N-terminal domain-containing protein n=1 Tax=Babjeviella inositovora NRRL Y-12698 TaxID=984486 RepID=A0A1E3QR72_9ASCO|nr:uncharacterized protein BABINDRAFT_166560 [Babjeviella inositovora NRRL Y-12698]ODQ80195.1 hypothetical protein BABINDRAFT_166560 [Babjeviella inositovora NRRL Y-12698]